MIKGYVELEVAVAENPVLRLVQADTVVVESGNTDPLPSFRPPTLAPDLLPCKAYILTLTQVLVLRTKPP